MGFSNRAAALFVLAGAIVWTSAAKATVILQDTFTQNAGNLSSRPVETPQTPGDTWNINNSNNSDVQVTNGVLNIQHQVNGFAKAIAPFSSAGITTPYTLSFDFALTPASADDGMTLYSGFGNATDNGAGFADYTGGPMINLNNNNASTYTLNFGPNPGTTTYSETILANTSYHIAITINPALSSDNVSYYFNNTLVGLDTYTGSVGGLWSKMDSSSTIGDGFTLDNITVSTTPEPASLSLIACSALALLRRRRR
jgi:hypothetical protein